MPVCSRALMYLFCSRARLVLFYVALTSVTRAVSQVKSSHHVNLHLGDDKHINGNGTLLALFNGVLYTLPLLERSVTVTLDGREVNEGIGAVLADQETVALRSIEPLDNANLTGVGLVTELTSERLEGRGGDGDGSRTGQADERSRELGGDGSLNEGARGA